MVNSGEAMLVELVEKLTSRVNQKFPGKKAALINEFIQQYYRNVSVEDLIQHDIEDLYGALLSHWNLINQREPGTHKVRIYNPHFDEHGWSSKHTIVEISHDDVPFLIDSVAMALNNHGYHIVFMMHQSLQVEREDKGKISHIYPVGSSKKGLGEAPIYIEISRQTNKKTFAEIQDILEKVFADVNAAVNDWLAMKNKLSEVSEEIKAKQAHIPCPPEEINQTLAFLQWLIEDHFTLIGYYKLNREGDDDNIIFRSEESSLLGVMRNHPPGMDRPLSDFPLSARQQFLSEKLMLLGKTSTVSTVHRAVHTDFVLVKIYDHAGTVIGEHKFIGLYTSSAYNARPTDVPIIHEKITRIMDRAAMTSDSHDGKIVLNILETLPREELFTSDTDNLYHLAMGILYLRERPRLRLFMTPDPFGRYFSCYVFVSRERFNSQLREAFQKILQDAFAAESVSFSTHFSESILARIHFVARVPIRPNPVEVNLTDLESKLMQAAKTWDEELYESLVDYCGEEQGLQLYHKYEKAFPYSYKEYFSARTAVYDIQHIEGLNSHNTLSMNFYRPIEDNDESVHFKIYQYRDPVPLSDVIPMLENMGLRVISERPHKITLDKLDIWINDFRMMHESGQHIEVSHVKDIFQTAFFYIWHGHAENDGFNHLVLDAELNWRQVSMLRAYSRYMWQIGFTFSQNYIEKTLGKNNHITQLLVKLFCLRFDPNQQVPNLKDAVQGLIQQIHTELDTVVSLDEDRILRRYIDVIMGTIRTNYYQTETNGTVKDYLSFKFSSKDIPDMPKPLPTFEIFVYSPKVEGVHLRNAKVARGGIRWSDRREDFRTEILGLAKAQQVKNAVIVPQGAKGGFVVKHPPIRGTREEIQEEGIRCYKIFVSGLLDLTDNLIDDVVVPPKNVVRYDADDTYLVVAADKGTATFSDIANRIAVDRGFWLGDAFASGGSAGYDHKKMGITARGSWESVKRHFREIGIDTQSKDFTVVGIGDMSGDVFGNGMLLSPHIKLVGAFNHLHIFIDPNPDPALSLQERQRLFNLPRSTWEDYNAKLISRGGGVFLRAAKSITVTPEMKALFGIDRDQIEPNELIRDLLKAPVDLLWNGGIGTYVKASTQSHLDAGDKTNDVLRVNAKELRCKVVGEGGNIGFTQLGRIEYALNGGRLNTDAIDNSAGVDCSDHEVNIKILLNAIVKNGDMTEKQRNQQLAEMTDEVAELVLRHNRQQTEALSVASLYSATQNKMMTRIIQSLEKQAGLDRAIEFLPNDEELTARIQNNKGLTRPELSVLLAYTKIALKNKLLATDLVEDPYIAHRLQEAFPKVLYEKYYDYMTKHRLKREIIATQITNGLVDEMGINFIYRLADETGAEHATIVKAYTIAREVFDVANFRTTINELSFRVAPDSQLTMLYELNRLVRRGARWFIRHGCQHMDIGKIIEEFSPKMQQVNMAISNALLGAAKQNVESMATYLMEQSVPQELAYRIAAMSPMFSALDIVDASMNHHLPIDKVAQTYYAISDRLRLGWVREQIKQHQAVNHWDALARAAYRDEMDSLQRDLVVNILNRSSAVDDVLHRISVWETQNAAAIHRWMQMVSDIESNTKRELTMFSVALRELQELVNGSTIAAN